MNHVDNSIATYHLRVQELTAESFSPFGRILTGGFGCPSYSRKGLDNWQLPFESDAPPRLQVMRYHEQAMRFSKLERHLCVTETRFPIGDSRAILIVAENDNTTDNTQPSPHDLRAFYMDGTAGIIFNKCVWHGLDCYPVHQPYADFLFLSDAETEDEIESLYAPVSGVRTEVIDYAETDNLNFEVVNIVNLLEKSNS